MAEHIVLHGGHEYRRVGGQYLRRKAEDDKSWLVLDHGEEVPEVVKSQFVPQVEALRFD